MKPPAGKLAGAGIIDASMLIAGDATKIAGETGMPADTIRGYQTIARKKKENAIITI